jgi:hypothetical protein
MTSLRKGLISHTKEGPYFYLCDTLLSWQRWENNATQTKHELVIPEQKVYIVEACNVIKREEELRWMYQRRFKRG